MRVTGFLPTGLARRFALAAAGLSAGAVLVVSLFSWWLINQQHQQALRELAAKERQFHAAAVATDLQALAGRMSEVASSTILATGLVDSAGRETYLAPFLDGIRQINGVPVQLLFTDFEGREIARNGGSRFTPSELAWLTRQLERGNRSATIFASPQGHFLLAMEPLTYARTATPEGALLYKVALADLHVVKPMQLEWGEAETEPADIPVVTPVVTPAVFQGLQFRIRGPAPSASSPGLGAQYLTIFVVGLFLFGAVVLAGMRLAHLLTRDLRQLESFSSKFISSGLSTERAPVGGSAEVANLAVSINEMLDRLHEQHSALFREREKLAELADALKAADRRKDEFLATLAHELRNPLAPIKNSTTVLRAKPMPDPQLAWARDVIDRQVDQMSRLLDDLLDVSRITRNKLELRKQFVTLAQVVDAAVETSRPLIEAASHELSVSLPAEPLYLHADPIRLAQVFANLLNNAAKYTPREGHIWLSAKSDGGTVKVSIKDNGIGISQEQLPIIFEMFMQTVASQGHSQGGLGIGLSLVRGLVGMHDGNIAAFSDGPGKGSEFVVTLPLARAEPTRVAPADPERLAQQPAKRILVADDNRDAAESLAIMLGLSGHDVRIAHDGTDALAVAASFAPEVVILDIGMPDMDGYEAARRIRAEPWGQEAMLIALTGWGQTEDKRRAHEAGFDHHLVKPADPAALQRLVATTA